MSAIKINKKKNRAKSKAKKIKTQHKSPVEEIAQNYEKKTKKPTNVFAGIHEVIHKNIMTKAAAITISGYTALWSIAQTEVLNYIAKTEVVQSFVEVALEAKFAPLHQTIDDLTLQVVSLESAQPFMEKRLTSLEGSDTDLKYQLNDLLVQIDTVAEGVRTNMRVNGELDDVARHYGEEMAVIAGRLETLRSLIETLKIRIDSKPLANGPLSSNNQDS